MADDIALNAGSGGQTVRALDDGSVLWPAGVVAYPTTIGTPDVLQIVDLTHGFPVQPQTGAIFPAKIDQTTPGMTDSVTVKANAYTSQPTVARPANATPYTAGDVVGGAITFTSIGPSGGHVVLTGSDLRIDVASVPAGMTTFRLYLYDVTPPSAIADNAAWDLPSGDRASFLGYIDLGTPADLGSTLFVQADGLNKKVKLNASTSLFGYLVTAGGFTPAGNSEVYTPRLQGIGV